ncbi:5'-nucleotidase C-terminal domain-containing protein [Bacillus dakarensis]|uniref:5'-nucleotidase C-terminal domain-containing protein n=1 Tax=Robertmurraya dakarensis TaxID=1926278 RepID=UPI001F02E768|nr:5'-nucleotidase C-terminal domain-containing protein [Bacillus dakarensis]
MSYSPKSYRKFMATITTAALIASAAAPMASAAEAKQFSDVSESFWAAEEIYSLVEQGFINGYEDNTYKPNQSIIRGQAANLLMRALDLPVPSDVKAFEDVAEGSSFAEGAAATKAADIFNGSNGKFNAGAELTREQMASVLVRAFDLKATEEDITFTDWDSISPSHQENIEILAQNGITTGKEDGSFDPKAPVNRATFAVFLERALDKVQPAPQPEPQPEPVDNYNLTIMHTNDTHAHLDNVAKRVTAVKNVRAEKPNALLVDAGDVFSGTLYFNEFRAQADLEFMNLMGYDLMTFGNHEFDLGTNEGGHQPLADFIKGASFPFVSANVDFSSDALFKDINQGDLITEQPEDGNIYKGIIKEIDGEKVGIFGLTTEETVAISSPEQVAFENYLEEAEEAVAAFEEAGIDKIVAVTHIGYDDNAAVDNDLELAMQIDGIDVIVGGHSHTKLDEAVWVEEDESGEAKEPTIIVQASQYGDYLGTVDVEFDENGVVVGAAAELIKVDDLEEDAEAAEKLLQYSTKIDEVKNTETGAVAVNALENPRQGEGQTVSVRSNETPLGNLITDGMLDKAKQFNPDTVIAVQNGGGIRAAIDAGPITLGDVLTTLPFGNTLATMELTGAELVAALEHSVSQAPAESGGFLHVAGMKFTYDSSKPAGERVVSVEVEEEEGVITALDEEKTYVIATNAFTAKGGDGFDMFAKAYDEGRVTDLGFADWENLRDYVAQLETVEPTVEGRIVDEAQQTENE